MDKNRNAPAVRHAGIDRLRIAAMLMIIAYHSIYHGCGVRNMPFEPTASQIWMHFLLPAGKTGVNLFWFMSGYLRMGHADIKAEKIIRIWGQSMFYGIGFAALAVAFTGAKPGRAYTLENLTAPLSGAPWWFLAAYAMLYISGPYLDMILDRLDKAGYQRMLILFGIPLSFQAVLVATPNTIYGDVLWAMYVYAIGGYLRKHADIRKMPGAPACAGLASLCWILIAACEMFASLYPEWSVVELPEYEQNFGYLMTAANQPLMLAMAALLFLTALKSNPAGSRTTRTLGRATFGVYLFHDHSIFKTTIWYGLFPVAKYMNSPAFIPAILASTLAIFALGTMTELLRQHFIEPPFMALANRISKRILDYTKERKTEMPEKDFAAYEITCPGKPDVKYIAFWFSGNEAVSENCDACIQYDMYGKNGVLTDGGEMDYDSEQAGYDAIADALNDVLGFALDDLKITEKKALDMDQEAFEDYMSTVNSAWKSSLYAD